MKPARLACGLCGSCEGRAARCEGRATGAGRSGAGQRGMFRGSEAPRSRVIGQVGADFGGCRMPNAKVGASSARYVRRCALEFLDIPGQRAAQSRLDAYEHAPTLAFGISRMPKSAPTWPDTVSAPLEPRNPRTSGTPRPQTSGTPGTPELPKPAEVHAESGSRTCGREPADTPRVSPHGPAGRKAARASKLTDVAPKKPLRNAARLPLAADHNTVSVMEPIKETRTRPLLSVSRCGTRSS